LCLASHLLGMASTQQSDGQPDWSLAAVSKNTSRVGLQLEGLDMRPFCSGDEPKHASTDVCSSLTAGTQTTQDPVHEDRLIAARRSRGANSGASPAGSSCKRGPPIKAPAIPPLLYDLAAIVHHSGSLDGGHYTAQCRHPASGVWHEFDDDVVHDASPAVSSASAYILVFLRQ
jgi:Ubiquitin carboxyl-terminal hydrolase